MKRLVILQSNYIPWKGYFDLIDLADEFVLLDTQYTKRDWRNRNRIKTPSGLQWLTIPVTFDQYREGAKGWTSEALTADARWAYQHWNAIEANYARAPYFKEYANLIAPIYEDQSISQSYLDDINWQFMRLICRLFKIDTPITKSDLYDTPAKSTQRLVDICQQAGATHYLTGPAAKQYMDQDLFDQAGIAVEWMSYDYPQYPQLHGNFEHGVTMLDLLFNVGPDMTYARTRKEPRC